MTHTSTDPTSVSLFSSIHDQYGARLRLSRFTITTLLQVSQTLENVIFRHQLAALFFVGFQQTTNRYTDTVRYCELLTPAQHVYTFADSPAPLQRHDQLTNIQLATNDALNAEWFVVITSPQFCAVIVGRALLLEHNPTYGAEFEVYWSFDPEVMQLALTVLAQKITHYQPNSLGVFHSTQWQYQGEGATLNLMTEFILQTLQFQEQIFQHLTDSIEMVVENEELLREVSTSIVHTVYVAQVIGNQVERILFVSPNCEGLSGYTQEDFYQDQDLWFQKLIYPDDAEYAIAQYNGLRLNHTLQLEYRIVRRSGDVRWIHDSVRSLPARQPNERRIYGVVRDITQDRITQAELLKAHELALALEREKAINAAKSTLMSTISHEFRTPLAAILSATEMIEHYGDRLTLRELRGRVAGIRQQVDRLREMMDDLSAILRADSGKIAYHPTLTNVSEFCQQVIDEVRNVTEKERRFLLTQRGITARAMIDPRLMRHAMMNLLLNAVKYSDPNTAIVCEVVGALHQVQISVKDQGIGIPSVDVPHVFEPFHRGKNVENITGTGLGLKIVKDYVELHGGTITASSVEGQGSMFVITLPTA